MNFLVSALDRVGRALRHWRRRLVPARSRLGDDELLASLLDAIPVMITVYDPGIEAIRVNREFERVLGWTNEDLAERPVMELCYPDPEYREEVRRFMASLEGWRDLELQAKDGSVVGSSWTNIRLADDRQVGIGVDVTARREAEREVRRAYEQERRAVQERDNLLAVVSHDLRNPLSAVTMASSLLTAGIAPDRQATQVAIIRRAVDQMKRLIDDLLDVARIEGGVLGVVPEATSAVELARTAFESMAPLAEARGVRLALDTGATDAGAPDAGAPDAGTKPGAVEADRDRILQVFSNLVGNAVDHTPEGGTVRISVAPGRDGSIEFAVSDTGEGIPPEDLPKVFDRYWQARKTGRAGAGLGLAIARGIVEAHGGTMRAESEEGAGSTFTFTLPAAGSRWPGPAPIG